MGDLGASFETACKDGTDCPYIRPYTKSVIIPPKEASIHKIGPQFEGRSRIDILNSVLF